MANEQVVNQEQTNQAPSALENAIASSPEVQKELGVVEPGQEAENATPKVEATQEPVIQQEEGKIPYSRFKEKVDEANWYKQQLELTIQQRQQQLNIQQPLQDPYANMTAEEKVFWQGIDKRIEDRAIRIADERVGRIAPLIEAGRAELAKVGVSEFRRIHPDIKPNSPEEIMIAEKIQQGYLADDAYWSVVGPRGFKVATEQVKQQAKQQNVAKKMANVETSPSINSPKNLNPQSLTVPKTRAERDELQRNASQRFRDKFLQNWNKSQ